MLHSMREPVRATGAASTAYGFRAVEAADLALLERWLNAEHVRRWWPNPAKQLHEIMETLGEPAVDAYIVSFGGRAIGYLQTYDPHADWALGPYRDQPAGTRGIDQFIGEADMIGLGHGPRFIEAICAELFAAGAPRVITDPDPANRRAVRAYEKASFRALDERVIVDGPVVLMARDRAD
ncbi:MAG: GNAT family N-acetyltransferase [Propylenella sp.]